MVSTAYIVLVVPLSILGKPCQFSIRVREHLDEAAYPGPHWFSAFVEDIAVTGHSIGLAETISA